MMRRFILFLLVFIASAWIGVKIAEDPGYVLIAYRHWTIEMPLWITLVILLFVFFSLYGILRLFRNLRMFPRRWRLGIVRRRNQRAQELMQQGLQALVLGDWHNAEKKLARAAPRSNLSWLNYLTAALACQAQQAFEQRDIYLSKVREKTPEAEVSVGIFRVKLYLQQRQFEQARAILQRLHQIAPKQAYATYLLAQVYIHLQEWENLRNLLPVLREQKFLLPAQIAKLTTSYVHHLIEKNEHNEAEELLRKALAKNWDRNLVRCYGLVKSSNPSRQLALAESWLPSRQNDPVLLLTLGRLSFHNQLWGKARSYLQSSINLAPTAETYLDLARLQEQLGDNKAALECYRQGLQLQIYTKA